MTQLTISHVGKTYADGTEALRDIQVRAAEGEIVAILGGSGCGKTTLLRLVAGLDVPSGGTITVGGETLSGTHPAISAVFQEPRLLPWLKVGANIAFGGQRLEAAERQRRTEALIERIGLAGYGGRWPRDLSGGQSQRVAIARALIGHPGVLLLDEPFSALDPFTRASLHELVLGLWTELKPTILMVTHDVDEAVTLADRIVVMKPRPGRVHDSMGVDLPRPREKLSSAFELMKRRVMRAIDRSLADERPPAARPAGPGGTSPWL